MCKAARPSGGMNSLNPCRCRGKQLHHHGGDVCCVFVLCVAVSLVVCKKVPKHNLKVCISPYYKIIGITFWSTHACTMPNNGTTLKEEGGQSKRGWHRSKNRMVRRLATKVSMMGEEGQRIRQRMMEQGRMQQPTIDGNRTVKASSDWQQREWVDSGCQWRQEGVAAKRGLLWP